MENLTTLINSFLIWKITQSKIFDAIKNIKNAFKVAKNFIKNAGNLASKLFPNVS